MNEAEETTDTIDGRIAETPEGLRFFAEAEPDHPRRLTSIRPEQAVAPDAGELDLRRYRNKAVRVSYRAIGPDWVYGVGRVKSGRD